MRDPGNEAGVAFAWETFQLISDGEGIAAVVCSVFQDLFMQGNCVAIDLPPLMSKINLWRVPLNS